MQKINFERANCSMVDATEIFRIIIYRITLLGRRIETVRYEGDKAGAIPIICDILGFRNDAEMEERIYGLLSTEEKPLTFFVNGRDSRLRLRIYMNHAGCT